MTPRVALSVVSWVSLERMPQGIILTMAKEVVQYCLPRFSALVTSYTYGIALTLGGIVTSVAAIILMLVLTVIDIPGIQRSTMDCKI